MKVQKSVFPFACVLLIGCSHHVYSPPSRTFPLQGPAPLNEGQNALGAEGGGSTAALGPTVSGGTLRYRRGIVNQIEINTEVSVLNVYENLADPQTRTWGAAGRLGVLGSPLTERKHVGFTSGIGAGGWAGGGFFAIDAGVIAGYENRYFVPRLGFQAFVSLPINARAVNTALADEDNNYCEYEECFSTPLTTFGFQFDAGFKVPIVQVAAIYGGFTLHFVADREMSDLFFGGGGGAEVYF